MKKRLLLVFVALIVIAMLLLSLGCQKPEQEKPGGETPEPGEAAVTLLRKESRPAIFYREDYAQRDDANWLKWILIRKTGDDIAYSTMPIES